MARNVRVACLLSSDFEDSEFKLPYEALKRAGHSVDVIGPEAGQTLKGKKGQEAVRADRSIADAKPADYELLFIPGGHSPDHLRADERFVRFVREYEALGRPLAAVCHGPQLMMTAGIVGKGRTLTAWKTVQGDLQGTGATVKDEPVVVDRNWVTSRKPEDLPRFIEEVLRKVA